MNLTLPVAGIVILAGGAGTRLRSVLPDRQKVVAPVAGRPMLAHLLAQCARAGAREATLAVGHRSEQVREELGDRYEGMALDYSVEVAALGTGGAIAQAASRITGGPVLVLNGDSFIDVDLAAVVAWHRARRARATLVLTEVPDGARYGAVTLDATGRVCAFHEKATTPGRPALVSAGIYVMEREVLDAMPRGHHSVERDVLPRLIDEGLFGWLVGGRFVDIGLPETYAAAADVVAVPSAPSRRGYVVLDRDGTIIEERVYLHEPEEVALLPGAVEGLAAMQAEGQALVIATNQAGIGRGLYSEADFAAVQRRLESELAAHGVVLSATLYCPHHPDVGCACRKPAAGMVEQARLRFGGELPIAVIGDKACDIDLARALHVPSILVRTGYGAGEFARGVDPDFLVDDLRGAAHVVHELSRRPSLVAEGA